MLSEVKKQGPLTSEWLQFIRSVRVKFFLCTDDRSYEMKKWEMDEGLGLLAEERTLLGFNLVLAISSISDSLRGPGCEPTAADVSEWLKGAMKCMSPKVVSVYIRIRDRFPPEAVVHRLQVSPVFLS